MGMPGRAIRRRAVSHVERYLDCPFKYFSSYVLGLEEGGTKRQASARASGDSFFATSSSSSSSPGGPQVTVQSSRPCRRRLASSRMSSTRASQGVRRRPGTRRNYLLGSAAAPGLAARAFAFEIEQGVGVVERLLSTPRRTLRVEGP
jgi:hypothetical protein